MTKQSKDKLSRWLSNVWDHGSIMLLDADVDSLCSYVESLGYEMYKVTGDKDQTIALDGAPIAGVELMSGQRLWVYER